MAANAEVIPTAVVATEAINASHPYFISHSDTPGMQLVNAPFDGKSFAGWKRGMLIAFAAKNKSGFIDGTSPKPAEDSDYTKMKRLWDELESLDSFNCSCVCTIFFGYGGNPRTSRSDFKPEKVHFGSAQGVQLFEPQTKFISFGSQTRSFFLCPASESIHAISSTITL